MNRIAKIFRISFFHLKQIFSSIHIFTIFLILTFFVIGNLNPVVDFCKIVNIPATPYAFPHIVNDFRCQLMIMAGIVLLFSKAPFENDMYYYIMPRSGKLFWVLGQVIYIILLSMIYLIFLVIISLIPFLGRIQVGTEWGKIWGTLAKTDAGMIVGLDFSVTEYMVSSYKPMQAMVISFLLEWACMIWLGLFIYFFNKITKSSTGTILGSFVVLLDICIANDWINWMNKFSPVTLAQINTYSGFNLQYHITLQYGVLFFTVGILVLSVLCVVANVVQRT